MCQVLKALKNKQSGKFAYFFTVDGAEFTDPDHELVTVCVTEIKSPLCASCKIFSKCGSGIKGNDFDCSNYQ